MNELVSVQHGLGCLEGESCERGEWDQKVNFPKKRDPMLHAFTLNI